jgi:SAM-dependent methyltransferase
LINFEISDDTKESIEKALKATTKHILYNGWNNHRGEFGYHSFSFAGLHLKGQRNNLMRISELKKFINFVDKSVLDLGCNTGGLLHHLPEIKKGRGYDCDESCLVAANLINTTVRFHNDLLFQTANLETVDLSTLAKKGEFDIIFLCSIGSWIKNWREVYAWAVKTIPLVVFEENNASEGASQLALFRDCGCKVTKIIEHSPDDNTGNRLRNTYLIETGCSEKD